MNLSLLTDNLPFVAVIAGVLLFAWSQKSKASKFILGLLAKFKGDGEPVLFKLTPAKRFEIFYALRSWCVENGYDDAVDALNDSVLQSIVSVGKDA